MTFHLAADTGFLIHRASRLLQVELQKVLEPYDLTREQWPVLAMLWDEEGVSQNKIGGYLCKDQPTVTRIIDRLEKKRLVKRVTNTRDRRAYRIVLTEEGRELKEVLPKLVDDLLQRAQAGLTEEQVAALRQDLLTIAGNLEGDG
ncbi:MAG: MarR family transcriptional regulator [Candidatus Tectomicrobia bacterium]|nr:MarR family transcriptional regulator [Candidatus Tectomicrobia bacterium]